ncbi:MAG TPA: DUF885 family protein [Fimbriimonas sp.]|nr:DUF885 family protein [Fimbriimonas sp.]
MLGTASIALLALATTQVTKPVMTTLIEQYSADAGSLQRFYNVEVSRDRVTRFRAFYKENQTKLEAVKFDGLSQGEKVDYLLFRNLLDRSLAKLDAFEKQIDESKPYIPFFETLIELAQDQRKSGTLDPAVAASTLSAIETGLPALRKQWEGNPKADKFSAFRAARFNDQLLRNLAEWYRFYNQYDPQFGWWVSEPYNRTSRALAEYSTFLREKVCGLKPGDTSPIVGDPIGKEALLNELKYEMIPYSPEELIEIANKEYAWCEAEMKKASREMGFGDDWKKALEAVKADYVKPGEQPDLIRDMAEEAIKYVEDNDLMTVPPLAKETWRMTMMSREQQKVSPFFLGGEMIMVSFPTAEMEHQEKLMSLRANNKHFARATVHHELIPGHHLQQFYQARVHLQRDAFGTPFWHEGYALYYEFLFWQMGFPKTPQNKVGMLFWRMHRCARIIFSLSFHLGRMTSDECIQLLVDKVGHERASAEGEVRRSFGGAYSPLYQISYMIGALQLWQLRKEVVDTGKMPAKAFHDQIFKENSMPIEMIRALVTNQPLSKDFKSTWKFYPK